MINDLKLHSPEGQPANSGRIGERKDLLMGRAAILLSIVTIVSLNIILILGAVIEEPQSRSRALSGPVVVLDLSLVSSSGLLGILFHKRHHRFLGAIFLTNIGILGVAYVVRSLGVHFPPWLLYGADIYWLNLYLICSTRNFNSLCMPDS